jgi:hypothetical protein
MNGSESMNENIKAIVSLTSHDLRLKNETVTRVIFQILRGTFCELKVCLTLYKDDVKLIPSNLKKLIDNGLVELIVADKDLGPHLKYFYSMQKYRSLPVITIDDDAIYPLDMVEKLYKAHKEHPNCIIARRCFHITYSNGKINSYHDWLRHFVYNVNTPTHKIFATGIGGILYPANCLNLSDDNVNEIMGIKFDDDFYLKALEVRRNLKIVNICPSWKLLYVKNLDDPVTQSIALWYNRNIKESDGNVLKYIKEFTDAIK